MPGSYNPGPAGGRGLAPHTAGLGLNPASVTYCLRGFRRVALVLLFFSSGADPTPPSGATART